MKKQLLNIYAGEEALNLLRAQGLCADDVEMIVGASSGPKWLSLHGIDEFLMKDFLPGSNVQRHVFGTSAGAWRMACYAQKDSIAAHDRLTHAYIEQSYSSKLDGLEIKNACEDMVGQVLGQNGTLEILNNENVYFNLIATQCHGLTRNINKPLKMFGFGLAALLNLMHRRTLGLHFTRVLMHRPGIAPPIALTEGIPSRMSTLNAQNLKQAILATGCIPIIIDGVNDLAGRGVYQDGGITDYGFDLGFIPESGLTLYPHFSNTPAPGWFDKQLSWRLPAKENYSKTVMIVPSDHFLKKLPFQKIPDRNDFLKLPDVTRQRYWREVVSLGQLLREELNTIDWAAQVVPLPW